MSVEKLEALFPSSVPRAIGDKLGILLDGHVPCSSCNEMDDSLYMGRRATHVHVARRLPAWPGREGTMTVRALCRPCASQQVGRGLVMTLEEYAEARAAIKVKRSLEGLEEDGTPLWRDRGKWLASQAK